MTIEGEPIDDVTELVDKNGLVKLFANRVRARVLAVLLYADEPLTTRQLATGAGIDRSPVVEAMEPLGRFEMIEKLNSDGRSPRYRLIEDDELAGTIERVATLATERYY